MYVHLSPIHRKFLREAMASEPMILIDGRGWPFQVGCVDPNEIGDDDGEASEEPRLDTRVRDSRHLLKG